MAPPELDRMTELIEDRTESEAVQRRSVQLKARALAALVLLAGAALYLFVWWAPCAGTPVDPEANLYWLGQAAHSSVRPSLDGAPATHTEEDAFLPPDEVVVVEPAFGADRVPAGWTDVMIVRPRDSDTGRWPDVLPGYVRLDELRAVSVNEMLGTEPRRTGIETRLESEWPSRWGYISAAEYGTEDAPVVSLVWGSAYVLYQIQADGRPRWLFARSLEDRLLMVPGVYVVAGSRAEGVPPDVLVFDPPISLECWRWQGSSLAPGRPRLGECFLLIWLWARGCWWWLAVAASIVLTCWACDRWLSTGLWVIPAVVISHIGLSIVLWTPYRFGVGLPVAIFVAAAWALSAIPLRRKTVIAVLVTVAACIALMFVGVVFHEADWVMRP